MRAAAAEFDVFLTTDEGIPYQRNRSQTGLGIVVLRPRGNRFADLVPVMEPVKERIRGREGGDVIQGGAIAHHRIWTRADAVLDPG